MITYVYGFEHDTVLLSAYEVSFFLAVTFGTLDMIIDPKN